MWAPLFVLKKVQKTDDLADYCGMSIQRFRVQAFSISSTLFAAPAS
tara:strand:- start:772 stop:909 length:138 start_codon:yes stop_codon:yes gene_type:complete